MKQTKSIGKLFLFAVAGCLLLLSSCKPDDPLPTADFTFTVTDLTVAFQNASADATSYAWDFGDGGTSTEASPSHTYADYGTYTVELEATGPGGTDTETYDVDVVATEPITIDGNFDDWTDVTALYSYPDGEGRTLLEAKVTDSESFLYFYIKGTSAIGEVLQVYIDADNNGATGWDYWSWFTTPGIEYLMEAVVVGWGGASPAEPGSVLKTATGSDSNWPWEDFITQQAIYELSDYVTSGTEKIIEFSLLKDMFTSTVLGDQIRLVICNSDNTWSNVGSIPPKETETAPSTYTMIN